VWFVDARPVHLWLLLCLQDSADRSSCAWSACTITHSRMLTLPAVAAALLPAACSAKARAHKGPVKVVYLLGADDYKEEDVPADAFVIYQVRGSLGCLMGQGPVLKPFGRRGRGLLSLCRGGAWQCEFCVESPTWRQREPCHYATPT
jgi:hypothetical protein